MYFKFSISILLTFYVGIYVPYTFTPVSQLQCTIHAINDKVEHWVEFWMSVSEHTQKENSSDFCLFCKVIKEEEIKIIKEISH